MIFVRKHHLGIDIGDSEVKAVLLKKKTRGWLVESVFRFPLTGADDESRSASRDEALRQIARATQGRVPIVTLGMSAGSSALKIIELPPADRRTIEQMLEFEAEQHLPFRADRAQIDFELLGRPTEDAQQVALAACDRGAMSECFTALRAGGVRPRAVDVAPLGIANCFATRPAAAEVTAPDGVMIVDLGSRRTVMAVLRQGALHAHHMVSFGSNSLTEAIAQDFEVASPEAEELKRQHGVGVPPQFAAETGEAPNVQLWIDRLAAELRVMIQSYRATARPGQIARVLLTGGGALAPGLAEALSRRVRLEVFVPNAWAALDIGTAVDLPAEHTAAFARATGLAMRMRRALIDVNLTPDLSREAIAAKKTRVRWVATAAAAGIALAALGSFGRARLEDRRDELSKLQRKLMQLPPVSTARAEGQSIDFGEVSRRAKLSRYNGRLWLELLKRFSSDPPEGLPEGVWLDEAHFDSHGSVRFRGAARTGTEVQDTVLAIRGIPAFTDVKLTYANDAKRGDETVVQFQIICTVAVGGGVAS